MKKEKIKQEIEEGYKEQYKKEDQKNLKPLTDDTIIFDEDMREYLLWADIDLDLLVGLAELKNSGDYWNELRYKDNLIIDHDAPISLTFDKWVDYLYKYLNQQ